MCPLSNDVNRQYNCQFYLGQTHCNWFGLQVSSRLFRTNINTMARRNKPKKKG